MATVYNIKLTSHWVNYTEEELKELILKALEKDYNAVNIKVNREC